MQLFNKGYRLGTLTVVSALSDVAEFTFDVDNHLFIAVGMDARLIGLFFMCNGVSSIVAGGLAGRLIPALGPARYTMLAQGCAALSQFAKGFASTPLAVFASLLPYTFGPMMTVSQRHSAHCFSAVSRPFSAVFPPLFCAVRLPGAKTERTGEKWRKMGEIWGRNGRETAVAEWRWGQAGPG